jgi:adenosylmethionine-8-amino-7-oxononanoate aminotransferase
MALQFWSGRGEQRPLIAALEHAYHGDTFGAMAASARGVFTAPFTDHLFEVARLPDPSADAAGTVAALDHLIDARGAQLAAVIVEPLLLGAGGMRVWDAATLRAIRERTAQAGVLLIADEVLTGFGRTGAAFAHQHWGVTPDIITCAKGITSGYQPLGAVIVHDRVARYFDANILACGLTYYAHPTACAAGVATLSLYEDEGMFENARKLGPVLAEELRTVQRRLGPATFVRSLGLLGALEFVEEAPALAWTQLDRELAARKLSLHNDGRRGTCIIAPPLCITQDELVTGMRAFGDAAVAAFGGRAVAADAAIGSAAGGAA